MTRTFVPAVLACALAAPLAHAASDEAIAACRSVRDATARLACYDALPLAPAAPKARATVGPGATPPQAARAPAPAETSGFGLPATTRPAPIEFVESHIEGHFGGWYAGSRIRLANGQTWQVTDGSSRFADVDNPRVTVRRGALGSFFLDIDGVNPAPRVKRVE